MEPLLETIDLDVEEVNELLFKVKVEGVNDRSPAKVRLVCEAGEVSYMFSGQQTEEDGIVQFMLPSLKDKLQEGTYPSRVEVVVENRYFAPVQFNINFKKSVKVVAEAVQQKSAGPQVTVTSSHVPVKRNPAPVRSTVTESTRPVARSAAPPVSRPSTLKDRYQGRRDDSIEIDEANEALIKELAKGFVQKAK